MIHICPHRNGGVIGQKLGLDQIEDRGKLRGHLGQGQRFSAARTRLGDAGGVRDQHHLAVARHDILHVRHGLVEELIPRGQQDHRHAVVNELLPENRTVTQATI